MVALLLAVPIGVGAAIFLAEYAPPKVSKAISILVDLLAAIPSVIYGLWGIFVLVPYMHNNVQPFLGKYLGFLPFFQGPNYGVGFLAASIILAIIIVPFIISVSREVILAVPSVYKESAYALGATKWEANFDIVLSYGRVGILGAVILALGRAIGETMAVTMIIGNNVVISPSLFSPGYTLASVLANEFAEAATNMYLSALIEIGLVLFLVSIVVNILATDFDLVCDQRARRCDQMKEMILASFERTRLQRAIWDKVMVYVLTLCAIFVLFILFNILTHLFIQGIASLNLDFFIHLPKPVGEKGGGMANANLREPLPCWGWLFVSECLLVWGPEYTLSEYADLKFAHVVRFMADVMNGIPSIVYGIFAYIVCVLPMKGFSALSGGFALGIMMIPMISRTSEQFVRMVPSQLREAGLALGIPKWRVTVDIIVPAALAGITTGVMVALARVAGETAPLLFTAFGNRYWQHSLTQPIAALPLQVFTYAISPFDDWHRQAWAGAIVLILMVLMINGWAQFYVMRRNRWSSGK